LVSAEPDVARWKLNWATALQAAGKPKDALEQLKIVSQNDTTNWLVYKNMGDCFYRLDSLWQAYNNYYGVVKK
jgi:predicted Zn-dependent protease